MVSVCTNMRSERGPLVFVGPFRVALISCIETIEEGCSLPEVTGTAIKAAVDAAGAFAVESLTMVAVNETAPMVNTAEAAIMAAAASSMATVVGHCWGRGKQ